MKLTKFRFCFNMFINTYYNVSSYLTTTFKKSDSKTNGKNRDMGGEPPCLNLNDPNNICRPLPPHKTSL